MFGEVWFWLAIVSAVAGGISSFVFKVAAKEKIDIVLLSFFSGLVATIFLFITVVIFSDLSGFWHPMLVFSGLTALTYLISNITKVKSLETIDAAIFFPLYKVFGPSLVIVFSIIFFRETFSFYEWLGLTLSLTIPLLLITKAEHVRQLDLKRGLFWLVITIGLAAVATVFWKQGADIAPNTWMYILVGEAFIAFFSFITLYNKHRKNLVPQLQMAKEGKFLKLLAVTSVVNTIGGAVFVFALTTGGPLGIVYTINSLYILIPIVLSIIFYQEHWNARKAVAIALSIIALGLFG